MPSFLREAWNSVDHGRVMAAGRALIVLLLGLLLARLVSGGLSRVLMRRASPQAQMLTRRGVTWVIFSLTLVSALHQLGFNLSVLVGAAGVFTVAIGFASQTSASNLISGLFLIGERPFVVGDVITFGTRTGEVVSIDLLSVKLRTFDNLFVRIPNEALLKSEIVNVTYYPIRRVDVTLLFPHDASLDRAKEILIGLAEATPEVLADPKPAFWVSGVQDVSISVTLAVWASREAAAAVKTDLYTRALSALRAAEVPLPVVRLHAG